MSLAKFAVFSLFLFGLPHPSVAEDFSHIWSERFGNQSDQRDTRVAVDVSGNVLLTGYFWGTVDFGGGSLVSAGEEDIFVAKLNANGTHLWSKRFGDAAPHQRTFDIASDEWGNVIVSGSFDGTVDFGGGPLTSAGAGDIFVVKFGADGNHLWSKNFGDAGIHQTAGSVAVDAWGNVIATGWFQGAVNFGGGWLTSAGSYDAFVAKFDPAGNHLWSKRFGDANWQWTTDVAVDTAGDLVMAGAFHGIVDFGGGPLTSAGFGYEGLEDIFMVKFDPSGNHIWSKRFGDPDSQTGAYVAVDASGSIFASGGFSGVVDFGGGPLESTESGTKDIFVVKFDPDGGHLWSGRFGDADDQFGGEVVVEESGTVVVAGEFRGIVDFGGGPLASAGSSDVFVARFDAAGNFLSSGRFGDAMSQMSTGVAADGWDHVLVAGKFLGTVDFGGGPLTTAGGFDIFLAKFGDSATGIRSARIGNGMRLDAYPNPFNPSTTLSVTAPEGSMVTVSIFDVKGGLVKNLVDDMVADVHQEHVWDGKDARGNQVSSGVYFCRLTAGDKTLTSKMILVR